VPLARWEPNGERAAAALVELLQPGDAVLVKASRSMGLEVVAETVGGVAA